MNFEDLTKYIGKLAKSGNEFSASSDKLESKIFSLSKKDLKEIVLEIGIIPENIQHDSTEEKLFSKATDIVLAKILQELGLKSQVNRERNNCADVVAKSDKYGYTLVADAKAFRLSRTAKNQKDFKVKSMADWRGDNDYAVLVCPYFQYPKTNSQIYSQALDNKICLLGWEHFLLFLEKSVSEEKNINLSEIWNISVKLSEIVTINNKDKYNNFHLDGNKFICEYIKIDSDSMNRIFDKCKNKIISNGENGIKYWKQEIDKIKKYSKIKAIEELIKALKLQEKINSINKFIKEL